MTTDHRMTCGDGTVLAYQLDGPSDGPAVVLSNSIATTLRMWDGQTAELAQRFRVIRYDTRGHGASAAPPGDYSLERLGRDVLELLEHLSIERAHFVGLSLGGFVGQWLAAHHPERIARLMLVNTSPYLGPAAQWDARIAALRPDPDMAAIAERFLADWFPPELLAQKTVMTPFRDDLLALDPVGLAGCFAAVRDADMRRTNAPVQSPTLVLSGSRDPVTVPDHGRQIAETIPNAQFVLLQTMHMTNVEQPELFKRQAMSFLP